MAQRVEKHLALFRLLVETTEAQRLAILKTSTPSQIRSLLEAIYNVLKGTCPISDKAKKKLYRQRTTIRRLVSKDLTLQQRQRLLVRHATLLPLLLKNVVDIFSKADYSREN